MIDIVYPLRRSAWNKEIFYSLRSLDQYFKDPCRVHICGDYKPEWLVNVDYHKMERMVNQCTEKNIALIWEWAANTFDHFIWMADDMYFLKDTIISDLSPYPYLGNMHNYKGRGSGRWAKLLWETFDMFDKEGYFPIYNYSTHTPALYDSKKLLECSKKFPIFTGDALVEMSYHNMFQQNPLPLTDKAGYYQRNLKINFYDERYRFLNHDDNGLSDDLKVAIQNKFNKKSKYEE